MIEPGRKFVQGVKKYRYGFNGKENDNEVKGEGNQQDYGMRPYDVRLGRLISVDPLTSEYPYLTPYQFAENNPIENIDFLGMQGFSTTGTSTYTLPTLQPLSSWRVGPSGNLSNNTQLINGPINAAAYAPQLLFITQEEFQSLVPPHGGAYINPDGISATIIPSNGFGSYTVSLIKERVKTLAELIKDGEEQFKTSQHLAAMQEFKKNIWTEKATPLVFKPLNTFQKITTDVSNLKAQDILDLKDRISKGTATAQDHIHAAALVKARLDYQINIKHDPKYAAGGANASILPANHTELWDNRTTYDGASDTWWSIEGKGKKAVFHQFKGDGNGTYHWAGSTSKNNVNRKGKPVKPVSTNNVPASTKKKAGFGG